MELNRILRPGGFFVWSATPVYRDDERDQNIWKGLRSDLKTLNYIALVIHGFLDGFVINSYFYIHNFIFDLLRFTNTRYRKA